MRLDVADASVFAGIAAVSVVHSIIPTHWLPFSAVARLHKWSLQRTLWITALGALLHVSSTCLLGISVLSMAHSLVSEEAVRAAASVLLLFLGCCYIALFACNVKLPLMHAHAHLPTTANGVAPDHRGSRGMEGVAVASVLLVPALSPCASTLPIFLAIEDEGMVTIVIAVILLLTCTITVMASLVTLSYYGASLLRFQWVDKFEKLIVGLTLCTVGVATTILHHHDHHL